MASGDKEIARLKQVMGDLMKRVPPAVNNGGVQQTRAYVAACKNARKQIDSQRATLIAVQSAFNTLNQFYS